MLIERVLQLAIHIDLEDFDMVRLYPITVRFSNRQ